MEINPSIIKLWFLPLIITLTCFVCSSQARQFYVGGRDGWVLNPSESYNHWTERMRFQVNDTLVFVYKNSVDSVLVVSKDDYDSCKVLNSSVPIEKNDGSSWFKFDRSGPFFFITGDPILCQKGQKFVVVVLAVRKHNNVPTVGSPSPSSSPSPSISPSSAPSVSPSAYDGDGDSSKAFPPSHSPVGSSSFRKMSSNRVIVALLAVSGGSLVLG